MLIETATPAQLATLDTLAPVAPDTWSAPWVIDGYLREGEILAYLYGPGDYYLIDRKGDATPVTLHAPIGNPGAEVAAAA